MFWKRKSKKESGRGERADELRPRVEVLSGEAAQIFDQVQALHMIAQLSLQRGDDAELVLTAIKPLEEALALSQGRHAPSEAATLVLMGHVYRKARQPDKARSMYERAVAVYKKAGLRVDGAAALTGLGSACSDLGRGNEALRHFGEALAIYEAVGAREEANRVRQAMAAVSAR